MRSLMLSKGWLQGVRARVSVRARALGVTLAVGGLSAHLLAAQAQAAPESSPGDKDIDKDKEPSSWQWRMFQRATPAELTVMASNPQTSSLFAAYGVSSVEEIVRRAVQVQEEALKGDAKRPYVCVLRGAFLQPRVMSHPNYSQIMARGLTKPGGASGKTLDGKRILDLGCCMGTDLRQMLVDGAHPKLTCGVDFSADFIRLGFVLFGDEARLGSAFQRVDILDGWHKPHADSNDTRTVYPSSAISWVEQHAGSFDVIHCGAFLHTFESKEEVQEVLRRIYRLLSPGGVCFGSNRPVWAHNERSLKEACVDAGFQSVTVLQRGANEKDVSTITTTGALNQAMWGAVGSVVGRGTFFEVQKPPLPSNL